MKSKITLEQKLAKAYARSLSPEEIESYIKTYLRGSAGELKWQHLTSNSRYFP